MPFRDLPTFQCLRAFIAHLAQSGEVAQVDHPISLVHEMTEVHRRALVMGGPVLRFSHAKDAAGKRAVMPVVTNLFGTIGRVAAGFGVHPDRLGELGEALASLRAPQPVRGLKDAMQRLPMLRAALRTRIEMISRPAVQQVIRRAPDLDLAALPVQTCWPGEPAPLITWPLVITRPPDASASDAGSVNVGVYRMQVLDRDRLIVRWLAHRGGAAHCRAWMNRGEAMPVAVAIGADPATMLAAVMPLPEGLSELSFAGLVRGARPRLAAAVTVPLLVPADAEIVIEGWIAPGEMAPEGPFGDHTGYYNDVQSFPVLRVSAVTTRKDPIYLTTFTGRPPDEPSVIGEALNEIAKPILRQQLPDIVDIHLPAAACSYRIAVVSIAKRYPGQARRVMMALWGVLPQFSYTKMIVVVDDDIDVRSARDVLWALSTRMDPSRDLLVLERTPIDYLDFASPEAGLGGKLGIDATTKIGPETARHWGTPLKMTAEISARVDALWPQLGINCIRHVGGKVG